MSWYTKTPDNKVSKKKTLWVRCKDCQNFVWQHEWTTNHNVCPICNYHDSLDAWQRIALLFDEGSFEEMFAGIYPVNSLDFNDLKGSYTDKIEENRKKTRLNEAVVTGVGFIHGIKVSAAIMDFRFLGGSLGSGTGEKIFQASLVALERRIPLIILSASGGARMQEGVLSLMQMAKTCAGIARLNQKNIPVISILANPTTGGVTASYAMMGDVHIAEPGAVIGFAGRRVIEQTIGEKLPKAFQTAEFLVEHGFVDCIVERKDLRDFLGKILSFYNRKHHQ